MLKVLDLHCVITFFLLCLMHSCSSAWVFTVAITHTHCTQTPYKLFANGSTILSSPTSFVSLPSWNTFHIYVHTNTHTDTHTTDVAYPAVKQRMNIIKSEEREASSGHYITSSVSSLLTWADGTLMYQCGPDHWPGLVNNHTMRWMPHSTQNNTCFPSPHTTQCLQLPFLLGGNREGACKKHCGL